MSWGIVGILAAVCIVYGFTQSLFEGICIAAFVVATCMAVNTLAWIGGLIAVIALIGVVAGGSFKLLLLVILGIVLMVLASKKDESES